MLNLLKCIVNHVYQSNMNLIIPLVSAFVIGSHWQLTGMTFRGSRIESASD